MNLFSFLSLRSRFLVAPFIGIILTLILYFTSNAIIQSHSNLFQQLSDSNLPQVSQISHVTVLLLSNHSELSELLNSAAADPDEERVYVEGRQILNQLHNLENQLSLSLSSSKKIIIDQVDILEKIKETFSHYREASISAIELSTVNPNQARQEMVVADTILQQLNAQFLILSEYHVRNLTTQSGLVEKSLYDQNIIGAVTIVLILSMVFSALYFSNHMSSELERINQTLIGLEEGTTDIDLPEQTDQYLRRYPFDVLKIDRSFVNDITDDTADRELVNAAIAMAYSLGLKVVAEGVETEEQLIHLSSQGCDFAQGYLFSKPVAPEMITAMLEKQNQVYK